VLEEVVAKLRSLGNPAKPKAAPEPAELAVGCICLRPLRCAGWQYIPSLDRLIMCAVCGETFPGRLVAECAPHPGSLHPQDVSACHGCRQANRASLHEFDLPDGLQQKLVELKKN
jgi:hypothetical protein